MHLHISEPQFSVPPIGKGACGIVVQSIDADGRKIALKKFDTSAINLRLLFTSQQRLETGSWPRHTMPILSFSYNADHASRITELYLRKDGLPDTLQNAFADFPNTNSLSLISQLADALAELHNRQVIHGNLKPGNLFFSKTGDLLLTDWCLGRMPDVLNQEYTDALLYASPEQLLEPEGFYSDAGYRWDVFAFGVLAFRLLTGQFPRCHEIFIEVDPTADPEKGEGVIADIAAIAQHLSNSDFPTWPSDAADQREAEYRDVIMRCLNLHPASRPASMAEVHREFLEIELRASELSSLKKEVVATVSPRENSLWKWMSAASLIIIVLILGSSNFQITSHKQEVTKLMERNDRLEAERHQALEDGKTVSDQIFALKSEFQKEQQQFRGSQQQLEEQWLAKFSAMKQNADILFESVFDPSNLHLSESDIFYRRITSIEENLMQILEQKQNDSLTAEEMAQVKLQLAEIALRKKDVVSATHRLKVAFDAQDLGKSAIAYKVRIAADFLHLAILQQSNGIPESRHTYQEARRILSSIPRNQSQLDRIKLLTSILNYKEAQNFSACGDHAKAIELLHAATSQLNELTKVYPDSAYLQKELSECFLESANVLESMNDFGNAREVRNLAVAELTKLVEKHPQDQIFPLKLCDTYTTLAHAAFIAGDTAALEQHSRDAKKLLDQILKRDPHNHSAATKLAAHTYFRSSLKEDIGNAAEALSLCDQAIQLLDFSRSDKEQDPLPHYYRALLLWQKGRLLGTNSSSQELALEKEAQLILVRMKDQALNPYLRKEHILLHLAQLLADIAHAYQRSQLPVEAKEHFLAAEKEWQLLAETHPENIDYHGQLLWCRERLKGL